MVAVSLATAYTAIAMILFYYDIRVRKEGFDLKMMAEKLSRLLKNAHLLRCPHPSSLRRTGSTSHSSACLPQAGISGALYLAFLSNLQAGSFSAPANAFWREIPYLPFQRGDFLALIDDD